MTDGQMMMMAQVSAEEQKHDELLDKLTQKLDHMHDLLTNIRLARPHPRTLPATPARILLS